MGNLKVVYFGLKVKKHRKHRMTQEKVKNNVIYSF